VTPERGRQGSEDGCLCQASIRECTQEEIGATTRLGASMQPAVKAGNLAKRKPAQAPEHGGVGDQDPPVSDLYHGSQIVDPH
jgi:hypothetical protein